LVELLKLCVENPVYDRALGCMFGSFMGDALGARLEFAQKVTPELVDKGISDWI
jgi:ADP-ribosylglycohydrolase